MKISEEKQKEILIYLQEQMGCPGIIVVCVDSVIPCENEKKGLICDAPHEIRKMSVGIHQDYLIGVLNQAQIQVQDDINETEKSKSVISPFK